MTAIPVSKAYWCENCSSVLDTSRSCPICGTTHNIISLTNLMPALKEINEVQAIMGTGDDSRG